MSKFSVGNRHQSTLMPNFGGNGMKHFTAALTMAALFLPASIAQAQPPEPAPPEPTPQVFDFEKWQRQQAKDARRAPQTMLAHFARSITEGNWEAAAGDVVGAENTPALQRLQKMMQQKRPDWQLTISPLFLKPDGEAFTARIATSMRFNDALLSEAAQDWLSRFEQVDVRLEGEEWKIVPRPQPPVAELTASDNLAQQILNIEKAVEDGRNEKDGYLNQWARIVAQPRDLTMLLTSQISQSSMSNVKQLLLGIFQLAQDNDERFAFDADNFVEKVMPYVKNEKVFQMPILDDEKTSGYTLNPEILGKSIADIDEPASTVAIYEAGNGVGGLNYRFNGRAVVGYADGHVKLLSPEQTTDLIWKIGPKSSG
jgi:prepilin-type processing-associated H-X9-DG protein